MKYFITGMHSSGKQEVVDILEQMGIKCGRLFSNLNDPSSKIYNSYNYELYSNNDINDIFENNAYVFIQELQSSKSLNLFNYYEGLSKYVYDNNDVFVLSPDQIINIPPCNFNDNICIVWMDGNKSLRKQRYNDEKRMYNFAEREIVEKQDIHMFVKTIYSGDKKVLYFSNEEPERVAAIIYGFIKHPDLLNELSTYFSH